MKIDKLCQKCANDCKQVFEVVVCPKFLPVAKKSKKKGK